MHVPASQAIDVAVGNGYVMAALSSGVLEYDLGASENRVLNALNALSDVEVSCITYEPVSKSFFVGYANGNLDQITPDGVTNIPAIKLAAVIGNKRVNKIIAYGGKAYVATGFALVVIDPQKSEVKDTYYPTNGIAGINDVAFVNDSIYVLSDDRLYRGLQTNAFLADPLQWTTDNRLPAPVDARYGELALQQGELHVSYHADANGGDTIFRITHAGLVVGVDIAFDAEIKRFHVENDLFYVYFDNAMVAFNENSSVNSGVQFYNAANASPAKVLPYSGYSWVADRTKGLVRFTDTYNFSFIQQEGPPKNRFFSLNGNQGKIVVTGGTIARTSQTFDAPNAYSFKDEAWTLFDYSTQPAWSSAVLWDLGAAAVHPIDPNIMAIGGYCHDALSIIDNGTQVSTVYGVNFPSPLETTSVGNGNICITALEYDIDGNLWIVNGYSLKPLKVRMADGSWQTFSTGSESSGAFTGKLAIDGNGNKWFAVYGTGMIGFSDGGTPATVSDDEYQVFSTGAGAGNLPSENVTAIAVDRDDEIWVGTDNGFAILYNSASAISAGPGDYDASRILITYEGNVEFLLGNTPITDIEIDGGNRKWLATASTGIFLLSPDGQEVLAQYTKENSPLISNNIMDMEFNNLTGELFIITDEGLVSFRTDASFDDENYETTTVFPNPVRPDYFGPITIQGIRYDSDVKITDIAGNVVYQTTSNGGTATWNGKTLTGDDVTSGVYLIWTATNTGKDRKVGKVAVVR